MAMMKGSGTGATTKSAKKVVAKSAPNMFKATKPTSKTMKAGGVSPHQGIQARMAKAISGIKKPSTNFARSAKKFIK